MADYDEIENMLQQELNKVAVEAFEKKIRGNTWWTFRTKETLGELGDKLGFNVCTSGFNGRFEGEWLFDICWYQNNANKFLEKIPLIVESEWGRTIGEIKYDFEKLLQSNAEHRLMICQAKPDQFDDLRKYFYQAIKAYQYSKIGDRFLFAIFDDFNTGEFEYRLILKE